MIIRSQSPELDPADGSLEKANTPWSRILLAAKVYRFPILVVAHLVIFAAVYYLALALRFESWFPNHNPILFWVGLPFFGLVKLAVFYAMRNFHGWWRYVTFSDLTSLARAATMSVFVIVLIDQFIRPLHFFGSEGQQVPKTIVVIDWAFTIAALAALRSLWRFWDESLLGMANSKTRRKRALLIGSDVETAKLAHMINSRPSFDVKIVGLVSLDSNITTRFSDLRVVGSTNEIPSLCKNLRAKSVYVPSGKLPAKQLRKLVDDAAAHELRVNVIPKLDNMLGGSQIPIREVKFDDLLRRPPVELDKRAIVSMVSGKTIMVTGAGGSIGSEICRQLMKFGPAKLILAGRGENRLYHIQRELNQSSGETTLVPYLVNITDRRRMDLLFRTHRPQVVFHAAAHKHVPLTEMNVGEAVVNNVHGTRIVADLSDEHHAEQFVLVSTDKAVNPTSVMGCTKQLAERYCLALGERSETKFVATRFGNVLGSEGSVVPLFKEQIRRGGPITITDKRMTRFFMTIPEAAQLVVQAATMGSGGEIFVLEMGQPVRIEDLAHDLIRLAGLPANAIDIVFTGIRPGEKLYEELYYQDEEMLKTSHKKILTAYHRPIEYDETLASTNHLVEMAYNNPEQIRDQMQTLIPEFQDHTEPKPQSSPAPAIAEKSEHELGETV